MICVCVCVLELVGKRIRRGTGRGAGVGGRVGGVIHVAHSERKRLWIKGHVHLLCRYRKAQRGGYGVSLCCLGAHLAA